MDKDMKYISHLDIVLKIIGDVYPVGETNTDDINYENLKYLTELTDRLIFVIDEIASMKNREEFSIKRAGIHCSDFLDQLGIEE